MLISGGQVQQAIQRVAQRVNADCRGGKFQRPVALITLNGALVFGGELFRQLEGDWEVGFVKVSSYAADMQSTGDVQVDVPPTVDVAGRDVIVVEDVVDSGKTVKSLLTLLDKVGARSVRIATLLFKPGAYKAGIPIDYVGLPICDEFVVGYGLDYDQAGRNLSAIYVLDE